MRIALLSLSLILVILSLIFLSSKRHPLPKKPPSIDTLRFQVRGTTGIFTFMYPRGWINQSTYSIVRLHPKNSFLPLFVLPKEVIKGDIASLSKISLGGQIPLILKVVRIDGHMGIEQVKKTKTGIRSDLFIGDVDSGSTSGTVQMYIDTDKKEKLSSVNQIFDSFLSHLHFLR